MGFSVQSTQLRLHRRRCLIPALAALVLFLQLGQISDLVHTHENDLQRQFDCEICLKLGSNSELLTSAGLEITAVETGVAYATQPVTSHSSSVLAPRSRAPPRI